VSIAGRIKILTAVFVMLAGANVTSFVFALHANNARDYAYNIRYALSSAMYEVSLASSALTRWVRFVAITGGELQYRAYWAEVERDRFGQALDTFIAFGAPRNEIALLEQLLERRMQMSDIEREVLRLRVEGYVQEAIATAHSLRMSALGIPFEGMVQDLITLTHNRTQEILDSARRNSDIFDTLIIVSTVLLALTGIFGLVWIDRTRTSWPARMLALVFVALAGANIFFSISAARLSREKSNAYELQAVLSSAIYSVELSTEAMTRWVRVFVLTGSEIQYNLYWEELGRDRFGQALDTFITRRAPGREVNVLVELVSRITSLRQIEAEVIQLRIAGYTQEAIAMAFSPEVAALGIPTNLLSQQLRENLAARTRETVDAASRSHDVHLTLLVVTTLLLVIAGFCGLAIKLRQVKHAKGGQKAVPFSCILKRKKNATIAARLAASFALVIAIFIVYVAIMNYFNTVIDNLNRHNTDFMMARVEILLYYHKEFAEMRRLLSESFMNSEWLEATNDGIWRSFELRLSETHARLRQLAEAYNDSIRADQMFPKMPDDSRFYIMSEIMAYIDTIYRIYSTNFFLSGEMSFYHSNVLDYTDAAEIMLMMLRRINAINQGIVSENIEHNRNLSNNITIATLVLAIVLALLLAYSMVKTFTERIKAIEANAVLVEQGNFEATLQNEVTDEISNIFTNLVKVFTGLVDEINEVAREHASGNTQVRINSERFHGGYKKTAIVMNTLIDTVLEQQEKMQIAQENSQAKSKFLANMSHEIRTPLTAVLGISELQLHNPALPLETEEAFAKIYSSANTLLGIVNDILDLSKIEAGKMELYNEKYDVASLLSDVAQLNLAYLGSKKLGFVIDVDKNIPTFLVGDELRIKQVLNNLFSNAFKYTDDGTVDFKVRVEDGGKPGYKNMVIVIRDTGWGMNKEQLKALFDEYTRFHVKEAPHKTGIGLGMPITFKLLRMMNGTIEVDSEVGKGTTVTVVLPQRIGSREKLGAETAAHINHFNADAHSAVKRLSFRPEPMPYGRVLVVDDVDANIYVAKGLMGLYQLQIDTCASGLAAIEKVKSGEVYDIIFMDQMMPEIDGMEATAAIRKMAYSHPIVALTANALVGQAEEFLRKGFDGFLSKPIQTVHLNAVLHKFVKEKHRPSDAATAEYQDIDEYFGNYMESSGINGQVYKEFARSQKNVMAEITEAIETNDFKTAHRLAHTLKGLAGLIAEGKLADIAKKAELAFDGGRVPTGLMDALSLETARVFAKIKQQYPDELDAPRRRAASLDESKAKEVFDKLGRLLVENSFRALEMIDDLAEIPQTHDLIDQIEAVEFALASESLAGLRKTLKV